MTHPFNPGSAVPDICCTNGCGKPTSDAIHRREFTATIEAIHTEMALAHLGAMLGDDVALLAYHNLYVKAANEISRNEAAREYAMKWMIDVCESPIQLASRLGKAA
jgi:hypothetical protein